MDGNQLVELLGHASANPSLDDFLSRNGVTVRPKRGNDVDPVRDTKNGLAFEYKDPDGFRKSVGEPRSEGQFVLRGVDFYADKVEGNTGFSGTLPFGLTFTTTEAEVAPQLGAPRKKRAGDKKDGPQNTYCVGDRLVVVSFAVGGAGVRWVRVALPTVFNREQGLCP